MVLMRGHDICFCEKIKKNYPLTSRAIRVATVRGKYLENGFFFQVREVREFVDGQGNLERTSKVREK